MRHSLRALPSRGNLPPILALIGALLSLGSGAVAQAPVDPAAYARLQWRYVGPVGNRVASVAGVPGDPNVYYAGAASGGIWKTVDGGISWQPIFDQEMVSSV